MTDLSMKTWEAEAKELTELLKNKKIQIIKQHRIGELMIEFTDGMRLFVNATNSELEFSVTGPRTP